MNAIWKNLKERQNQANLFSNGSLDFVIQLAWGFYDLIIGVCELKKKGYKSMEIITTEGYREESTA